MAILSIKGSQPPYCRHALKCEVFAHSRFGKLEESPAAVASSPPKTVVPSENLIRWIRSRKENRIMIETDGDLLRTSARIYVGLLSFA